MNAIKSVLKEEMQRLEHLCRNYRLEIGRLPKGSIADKQRKGKMYAYLVCREGGKIRFKYVGRSDSENSKQVREKIKSRKKYQELLRAVQRNLRELRKVVHE